MNYTTVNITQLHPFEGSPFTVQMDRSMDDLAESIREQGIFIPLAVRQMEYGEYEIICGHRRYEAAKMAGIEEIPVLVYDLSRDEAVVMLVDDNLTSRKEILPSEKAFAYKMKLEALKHQGRTSGQIGQKWSRDEISLKDSGRTVQRYIRLTYLDPLLLRLVDEKRIAVSVGVELSYLRPEEQRVVAEYYQDEDVTPSYSQAVRFRKLSLVEGLDDFTIQDILSEVKPNQAEMVKIPAELIRKYSHRYMTDREAVEFVENAMKQDRSRSIIRGDR